MAMKRINPKDTPLSKLHSYLVGAVAPRPIAFASTIDKEGNPNLAPFSFFNLFSGDPPVIIFSPARKGRDNTPKHTFENILENMEVVVNVVSYNMVEQASLTSGEYPKGVNEFIKGGFTQVKSEMVKPFRVKESPVQLECKVRQVIPLGKKAGAGNLVIAEIVLVHINENVLDKDGNIDPNAIDLVGRMGKDYYCRTSGNAVFEVAKPLSKPGMGIDRIPASIRDSNILTGNNLGQLGSAETLPDETSVNEYKLLHLSEIFSAFSNNKNELKKQLHIFAQQLLTNNKLEEAWKTLLAFN